MSIMMKKFKTMTTLNRVKCPACLGTKKLRSFSCKAVCPWCASQGHISLETERAFRAVKKLIPIEFVIVFGGFKTTPNQDRLDAWINNKE